MGNINREWQEGCDRLRWVEKLGGSRLNATKAHDINRRLALGYYLNDDCHDTIEAAIFCVDSKSRAKCDECEGRGTVTPNVINAGYYGIVERCERCDGTGTTDEPARVYFYAGFLDPFNSGAAAIDFRHRFDDEAEAARAADGIAERYAEREREYQREESAKIAVEEAREAIKSARVLHSKLIQEWRALDRAAYPESAAANAKFRAMLRRDVRSDRKLIENGGFR